jgi:hypothetical protein
MDYGESNGRPQLSEAFPTAVGRLELRKYIDQIQDELTKIVNDVGPGKNQEEIDKSQERLQELLRKQAQQIAKEMGVAGNHVFVFMIASAILSTAWTSFYIKRQMNDLSRSFEERLELTEMLNSLQLALGNVISEATNYAEVYGKKSGE